MNRRAENCPPYLFALLLGEPRAIITHCGSEIVTGDEREISAKIRAMAAKRRVDVCIAYDGMKHHAVMRLRMDSRLPCRTYKPQVVAVTLWATHSMNVTRSALRTAKRLQVSLIPPLLATVADRIVCVTFTSESGRNWSYFSGVWSLP